MFQCKNCGRNLDAELENAQNGVVICPACMCRWPVPAAATSTEAKILLSQGELFLDTCHFDEAKTAYEKAAKLAPEEAEAYFGMALAAFKVQYLKDEVNNRLQPICHEFSQRIFSEDKNYLRALELASEEKKKVYQTKAQEIDAIREEFCRLKQEGVNYDCFLCVKVTEDETGRHTEDCYQAQRIFGHLEESGHHPFFSEKILPDRTGADYEAHILYALYVAKCMLIICSDEKYLGTPWVKNEYSRYMKMIGDGDKAVESMAFASLGGKVERLPSGKRLQSIDLSDGAAWVRISKFVEKFAYVDKKADPEAEEKKKKFLAESEIENGVLIKYKGTDPEVMIPDNVTEIGDSAFKGCTSLMSIKIPDSVTSIGDGAFFGCSGLTSITIPDNMTWIEGKAFFGCKGLTSITIPDNVRSIEHWAFGGCSGLTSIIIPDNVTSIGNYAFCNCSGLTSITIPQSVISIGESAFEDCNELKKVTMPKRFKDDNGTGLEEIFGDNYKKIKFKFI